LLAIGFIYLVGFTVYHYIRIKFIAPFLDYIVWNTGISKEQRLILEENFLYYKALTTQDKREFEKRLKYFIHNKEFIAKDLPEVTEEMRVMVGASAVQLTFGYAPIKFPHFSKIVLFPGKFYSKGSKKLRKGEVNNNGLIVLSWIDFIRDYKIYNDGINLGLHEMAHALKVEDSKNHEYALLDEAKLAQFYEVSKEEYFKLRKGKKSFIRSYAGKNQEEFFAVAIEQFFEQPKQFKEKLPQIYHSLTQLLNQDPAKSGRLH
jgi:hypothetical protein